MAMGFFFSDSGGADDGAMTTLVEQLQGADAVSDQLELLGDALVRPAR